MKHIIRKDESQLNGILLSHSDVTLQLDQSGFRYEIRSANGNHTGGYIPLMKGPKNWTTISGSTFVSIDPPIIYFTEFEGDSLEVEVIQ